MIFLDNGGTSSRGQARFSKLFQLVRGVWRDESVHKTLPKRMRYHSGSGQIDTRTHTSDFWFQSLPVHDSTRLLRIVTLFRKLLNLDLLLFILFGLCLNLQETLLRRGAALWPATEQQDGKKIVNTKQKLAS